MARTPGTKNCGGCRFWSEMVAKSEGGGPMQALCLVNDGSFAGKYTTARQHCPSWKENTLGAIDDPPDYGKYTQAAYIDAEGPDALQAAV